MKTIRSPNLARGDDGIMVMVTMARTFARGGLVKAAGRVRGAGRFGDTLLVHINEREFNQLRRAWGEPHYNPDTELPEFFSLGDITGGISDFMSGDWGGVAKDVAPYVLGALGSKSSRDQANQNPAPPADPNMTAHLANFTNSRTRIPMATNDPSSYYTYGEKGPETQFFKNNGLASVTGPPGAQLPPRQVYSPSTAGAIGSGALNGIVKYLGNKYLGGAAPRTAEMTGDLPSGAFAGQPGDIAAGDPGASLLTGTGADTAGVGGGSVLSGVGGPETGNLYGLSGIPSDLGGAGADAGGSAAASGSGAGSGLGATLGGVAAAVGLGVLGKHLQDNTAGIGYNYSRQLASGLADAAKAPDPTHGRGADSGTMLSAPPPGFKNWTQYFYATQMVQQSMHASGGAKDQGTYRMLFQEAGLPSDPAFYMKEYPGQAVAYNAIIGPQSPASGRGGRARGGLAMAMGGLTPGMNFMPRPMSGAGPLGAPGGLTPAPGMMAPGGPGLAPRPTAPTPGALGFGPRPGSPGGDQLLPPPTSYAPPPRIASPSYGGPLNRAMAMGAMRQSGPRRPLYADGGPVDGPGTGTSDDIPARLSAGEYIVPAHVVAALGDGSTTAGAAKLDRLQKQVRLTVGKQMAAGRHPKPAKEPIDYMNDEAARDDMNRQARRGEK